MNMKKRISAFLSFMLLILFSIASPLSAAALQNDLNGDGKVSVADAVLLNRILAENYPEQLAASVLDIADTNQDGLLTILDIRKILTQAAETTTITTSVTTTVTTTTTTAPPVIARNGAYTSKEDVALYIHTYNCLPQNFITKKEAQALGWEGGSLEPYAPGCCIGGSYFGNYEGYLPAKEGRDYYECDIDTLGKSSRGAKRLVYSNDGLIYYTEDHYTTFELIYGKP